MNIDETYITSVGVVHNCRCVLLQEEDDVETTGGNDEKVKEVEADMQPLFKMNPGKDGYVFKEDHPYFQVAKKDKAFAKENFGLPLPEDKETAVTKESFDLASKKEQYRGGKGKTLEEKTMYSYSVDGYKVNEAIRSGNMDESDKAFSSNLQKSLAQLPNYEGTVYRGMSSDAGIINSLKSNIGGELNWEGFTSSSKSAVKAINVIQGSTKEAMLFEIESKTGKSIEHLSKFDYEKEVLFNKSSKFTIESVEDWNYGGDKAYKVKLKEI